MHKKEAGIAVLNAREEETASRLRLATIVTVVGVSEGLPLVRIGADGLATPARVAVPYTQQRLRQAVGEQGEAVAVFEDGDPLRPVVLGFIEQATAGATAEDGDKAAAAPPVFDRAPADADGSTGLGTRVGTDVAIDVDADGRRLQVTARDEIVLKCGKASITLRRNGRIIIRGTYVETHSDGTNRIKGGQVQIN
jgi:hypothetical protein